MKKILITVAVVIGLLFALLQLFAMIGANGIGEKLARAAFAGVILLIMVIAYQRKKRPTDTNAE